MRIDLKDKVALVTGSAHRVGKVIATELARQGVHILVHYRSSSEDKAMETVRELKSLGVDVVSAQGDLSKPADVARVFERLTGHFGRLDILVNSASILRNTPFLDIAPDEWNTVLGVNLTGPFLCGQAAARLMRANQAQGVIINIVDNSGLRPWPKYPNHSVSKAGLIMLTQVMARALAPDIRVNAIAPGPVMKLDTWANERWAQVGSRLPLKRPGSAEDIGRAVVYLASEDFITGEILRVDGGEWLGDLGT